MSTYSGNTTDASKDASLQLAPVGEKGPDINALTYAFNKCVSDNSPFIDQCRQNFETRYAIWPGQSADGKKHAREGAKIDPTPWDGASDLRVYLTDNVCLKKIAMMCMAVRKANLVAVPIEGNDIKRAKIVSNFMKWLVHTQIPGLDREQELLANYLNEKGVALTGQFWETRQEKMLKQVTVEELMNEYPRIAQEVALAGSIDPMRDDFVALFEEIYGCTNAKAKKMLTELSETGATTVAVVGKERSYPVIRAFNLDSDVFIPPTATDLETCPEIHRVQYFTPEQLRGFKNTAGWDEAWIEKAIKTCKGKLITVLPQNNSNPQTRSFIYIQQRFTDMIGVVYSYQRLSDEDGVPGIYLTIWTPLLPKDSEQRGYAQFGLFSDNGGDYPFVLHRREYLSRKLHDSRGIPEPGKPWQDQIKAHRDSRIDAASLRIIPTLFYPIGRPPARLGPGARVPERRPGEYHFGEGPPVDPVTDDSENRLLDSFREYNGFQSKDGDQVLSPLENQFEIDKFLTGWSKAYQQVFNLYKRFGSEEVAFRVIGVQQADAVIFEKGNEDENFDFYLGYDVQSQDFELMTKKLTAIVQASQQLDRDGNVIYSELLQVVLDSIDPNIAQRILQPSSVGTKQQIDELQGDFAKLSAGINVNLKPNTPPQIAMQAMQNWLQAPDVQQKLMQDEPFKERVTAYAKQIQMAQMQQENAQIGRLGSLMPGPVIGS